MSIKQQSSNLYQGNINRNEGEINNFTLIVGKFKFPLSIVSITTRQMINKREIDGLYT